MTCAEPSRTPARRIRRRAAAAIAVVALGAATACGGGSTGDDAAAGAGATDVACNPTTAASEGWVEPVVGTAQPKLPVTVTDFTGEEVTVTDTSRILAVDTYGTLATTVYALGLGDSIVGRDVSTGIPALADLPVVTHNGHELNAEAILDLDPSVILTDYSIGPLEVQLQLKEAGIPVVILDSARNREVIDEQIRTVAQVLGVDAEGEQLVAQVDEEIAAAQADVDEMAKAHGEPIRMVFLYMRGNAGVYYWFGKGSGADDLIDALGGEDVATESGLDGAKPLNAEGLVKSEPGLFLMMTHGLDSVGGVDGLLERPGVAETDAGVNGCVVDMSDYEILSFGPQFPSTLRSLGEAIYGSGGVFGGGNPTS